MKLDAITTQPVVETARFVLRPLRRSDAGLIEFYTKDERVARQTTTIPHPLPLGRQKPLSIGVYRLSGKRTSGPLMQVPQDGPKWSVWSALNASAATNRIGVLGGACVLEPRRGIRGIRRDH